MSIYDQRDKPAYENFRTNPADAENLCILSWWTLFHDGLLAAQIKKDQWVWYWSITDEIVSITPKPVIEDWKRQDSLCAIRPWYNVLMYFAAARAECLGLTKSIRSPQWKTCVSCQQQFVEDSLPVPIIKRLGIEHLVFCAPCFSGVIFAVGDQSASRAQVLGYLKEMAIAIQRIPTQDFGSGVNDFRDLTTEGRFALFKLLKRKPALRRVKELYGSWQKALAESGLLEDGRHE